MPSVEGRQASPRLALEAIEVKPGVMVSKKSLLGGDGGVQAGSRPRFAK